LTNGLLLFDDDDRGEGEKFLLHLLEAGLEVQLESAQASQNE